ncbi:MAG: SpoIIE family protein phosphatase [Verrucomicrobiales bacterium]|nr:SpoIIE family protein phosphatase [Verrucomicrobiales bacterium]
MERVALFTLICLLVGTVVGCWLTRRRFIRRLQSVEEEGKALLAEERRMFCFLHDLGESLTAVDRSVSMHRLIVDGVMSVTDTEGGALYLLDEATGSLVPKYCSDRCAPLVKLPERIVALARQNPSSLLSFLRLHAVDREVSLLGQIFTSGKPEIIPDLKRDQRLGSSSNPLHPSASAMVSPLVCGGRQIGVLAVTAARDRQPFRDNDFDVFRSIAEQSAFALANALVHEEAQAKQQIESELRAASAVQRILLPDRGLEIAGYEISALNIAARVLSGDFYDCIDLGGGRHGVVIADVSGKGTAAALISAMCRTLMRCIAPRLPSPSQVLAAVNRQLCSDIQEDMFVTMVYLVIDANGSITLARAGHTAPLIWRAASRSVEEVQAPGMAVGLDDGGVFERVARDVQVPMAPGDTLLLYTDGVSEAMDAKELMFGEERIKKALARQADAGAEAVVQGLSRDVDHFAITAQRSLDDITLIALKKPA